MNASEIISGIALVVAILSFIHSWWNARQQDRQWRAVNIGKVELSNASFIYWRVLSEDEIGKIDWGYNVEGMPLLENGNRVSNLIGIPQRLVAIDPSTKKTIVNVAALTMSELQKRLAEAGITNAIPAKHYQMQVEFKVSGMTAVSRFRMSVEPKLPDTDQWGPDNWGQPADIPAGRTIFKLVDLTAPIDTKLPERLRLRARLEYRDSEGQQMQTTIPFYFHSPSGGIYFGE